MLITTWSEMFFCRYAGDKANDNYIDLQFAKQKYEPPVFRRLPRRVERVKEVSS